MTIDYSQLGSPETRSFWLNTYGPYEANEKLREQAVAGAECNTVIELKPEHHAALPWHFA